MLATKYNGHKRKSLIISTKKKPRQQHRNPREKQEKCITEQIRAESFRTQPKQATKTEYQI